MSTKRIRVVMSPPAKIRQEVEQSAAKVGRTLSRTASALVLVGLWQGPDAHRDAVADIAPRLHSRRGETRAAATQDAVRLPSMIPIPIVDAARAGLEDMVKDQMRATYPTPPPVPNGLLALILLQLGVDRVSQSEQSLLHALAMITDIDRSQTFTAADLEGALLAA